MIDKNFSTHVNKKEISLEELLEMSEIDEAQMIYKSMRAWSGISNWQRLKRK